MKGNKTSTWRLFDDKDLSVGDELSFVVWETGENFLKTKIIGVKETTFGKLTSDDWEGHEKFESEDEMYKTYSKYYNRNVDENSPVKVVKFEVVV